MNISCMNSSLFGREISPDTCERSSWEMEEASLLFLTE